MPSAVPPPSPPSSKPLCIRVLVRLGKGILRLQQDAAFIGRTAIGARGCTCKGGPHHDDETCRDGKVHVANGAKHM